MEVQDVEKGVKQVEVSENGLSVETKKYKIYLYLRRLCHVVFFIHHMVVCFSGAFVFYDALNSTVELLNLMGKLAAAFGTNWNFTFQVTFLTLSLIYDFLEWRNKHETPRAQKIAYWRDVIFTSLVYPFTCFVSSMFWLIYWIDRELVFPAIYDTVVPWWFNHCVHTNILIVIAVETILQPRRQPRDRKVELWINSAVAFGYAIVYYSIYFIFNRWLYQVFGVLNWWQVCLYQICIWTSTYVFYFVQFPINRLFHPEPVETVPQKTVPEKTVPEKPVQNGSPMSFEIKAMQKNGSEFLNEPFTTEDWNLKYRTLRDKFENSRL